MIWKFIITLFMISIGQTFAQNDPYLWLEEVEGQKALDWVTEQNYITLEKLASNSFAKRKKQALKILNDKEKLPFGRIIEGYYYHILQNETHKQGILRRILISQMDDLADESKWETILDLDLLSRKEKKSWLLKSYSCLSEKRLDRCLISLSNGGKDAVHIREYDFNKRAFVANGFEITESKSSAVYQDENTLLVADALSAGVQTASGYASLIKSLSRGQKLDTAPILFKIDQKDMALSLERFGQGEGKPKLIFFNHAKDFWSAEYYYFDGQQAKQLSLPNGIYLYGISQGQLVGETQSSWNIQNKTIAPNTLVLFDVQTLLQGTVDPKILLTSSDKMAIENVTITKDHIFTFLLNNVSSQILDFSLDAGGQWQSHKIKMNSIGTMSPVATDFVNNTLYFTYENFVTPESLMSFSADSSAQQKIKQAKSWFKADERYTVDQRWVVSTDGTLVPYFLVYKKGLKLNGKNPTHLYGYGGFRVPLTPSYSSMSGKMWLDRGGVYAMANIRGGGEFGIKWHEAALREKRQNAYDDFISIAEDLISSGVTSPEHLGIEGGSNGGLLMGVMLTQRPDLFNAIICAVPLLDMKRYNKLLAGASWMGEYGDPDTSDWDFIQKYSPYQNLKANMNYPEIFFMTSTKDDRVHPGHARKMAKKMIDMGYNIYYYEAYEGGHSSGTNSEAKALSYALKYTYLWNKLK